MCLLPTWYIDISKASVATIPRLIQNLSDAPGQLQFLSKVEHLSREKFYGQFSGNFWFSVEVTVQHDTMLKCTTDIFARSVIIHGCNDNIDKATFLLDVSLSFELKHTRRVVHKYIRTLTITNFYEYVYWTFYRKHFEISLTMWHLTVVWRISFVGNVNFLWPFVGNCGQRTSFCELMNFARGKCQFLVGFVRNLWEMNFVLWIICGNTISFCGDNFSLWKMIRCWM